MAEKKDKESMQIQVGVFVIVGLSLLFLVIFMLGNEKKIFERQYTLHAFFPNISGLRVGAPIQLAGINIGTVNKITFDEMNYREVKVTMNLTANYQEKIRDDSVASIQGQGLLGDKMIFISVGDPKTKVLVNNAVIKTEIKRDFGALMEKGYALADNVDHTITKINTMLDEVNKGDGLLHALIYDQETKRILDDIKIFSSELKEVGESARNIVQKVDDGQGTLGALVNDPSLYNDMKTLLGKANRNKLIKAVVRYTLQTKDEKLLEKSK